MISSISAARNGVLPKRYASLAATKTIRRNEQQEMNTKTMVLFSLCGIAAPIVFASVVVIAGMFYPGYSHSAQAISELAAVDSPVAVAQNVNSFVTGVLLIAFARALRAGINSRRESVLGPALIGFFGVTYIGYGFLPCDPGGEFVSIVGSLHNAIAMCSFFSVLTGIFIVSRTLAPDPNWGRMYRLYSLITAAAGLITLVLWLTIASPAPPGVPRLIARVPAANGTLQRVFLAIVLQWIEVMAIRLFVVLRRRQEL
jgi:hypothetical membrane protein